jgi:hypothetical protein
MFTFGTASRSSERLAGGSSPSLVLEQPPEVVEAWQEDHLHLYLWMVLAGGSSPSLPLEHPPKVVKSWQEDPLHL